MTGSSTELTWCADLKINFVGYAESCPAILATSHKDMPVVYKEVAQ